jgi:2-methylcitrate dehydratase PrpD
MSGQLSSALSAHFASPNTPPSATVVPLMDSLAAQCHAWHRAALGSPGLQTRAAWHVLDWLGNAAVGATTGTGQAWARWLMLQGAGDVPTLAARRSPAAAAAAFHGSLASLLEMDDVHRSAILHPGPVVLPAVLAAAQHQPSGAQLLAAVVAGYEAMVRVGRALGPSHYQGWHSTATAGSFGAAAACALLLGATPEQTTHSLALAGTRSGGLWQVRHEPSQGKAWHMAAAARDGLAAAQLSLSGLTGPRAVLEGPSGWFAASAPEARPWCINEARTEPWLLDVSFKPWPACRHAHPAMHALSQLLRAAPVAAEAVAQISVHSYADALRFCDRVHPQTPAEARFSIQHALAAWLCWGEPQRAHYEEPALALPGLAPLRERVVLAVDAALEASYPERYGARVEMLLRSGERRAASVEDTYGDPACPMPPEAIAAKARALMQAAGWSSGRIEAAVQACLSLPSATSLSALWAVFE